MLASGPQPARAALPGELDPTFNGGQPLQLDLARTVPRTTTFFAATVDASGGVVVTGAATDATGLYAVAIARLDASGALVPSFGVGGSQVVQFGLGTSMPGFVPGSYAGNIGARPGGGWLVMGQATSSDKRNAMMVGAFDAAGIPDVGFGNGGSIRPQPAGAAPAQTYGARGTVGTDGSSFVAGLIDVNDGTSNRRAVLAKVTAAGNVATGFGNMPAVGAYADTFDQAVPANSGAAEPIVTPNGILVAGQTNDAFSSAQVLLFRLSLSGTLDTTFAGGVGFVRVQAGDPAASATTSTASSLAVGPDGEIYVAGYAYDGDRRPALSVTRFTPSGVLDGTFATGGTRRIQTASGTGATSSAGDVQVQADGKVLLLGTSSDDSSSQLVILRLETNGALDPTFGAGGIVRFGPRTGGAQGVLGPDGRTLVVTGGSSDGSTGYGLVARVLLEEVIPTTTTTTLPGGCPAVPSVARARCRVGLLNGALGGALAEGKLRNRFAKLLGRADSRLTAAETLGGRALRRTLRKALAQARRVRRLLGSKAAAQAIAGAQLPGLTNDADTVVGEIETLVGQVG